MFEGSAYLFAIIKYFFTIKKVIKSIKSMSGEISKIRSTKNSWKKQVYVMVACKRQSSIKNSRAWLRRFDDVTRVGKSCVAKTNRKKAKEKYFIIANKYALSPNI